MKNEGRIGPGETIVIAVILVSSKIFLTFAQEMVDLGLSAAWLVTLFAVLAGLVALLPLLALLRKFPGKTIIEAGEELVGPQLNIIFCLGYLAFFVVLESVIVREFAERAVTVAVPDLPISIAILGILLGAVVAVYLGLETIGRSSRISFFLVGILYILVMVLTFPYWRTAHIFPLLGPGLEEVVLNGVTSLSHFSELFVLALIYPAVKLADKGDYFKYGIIALFISGAVLVATVLAYSLIFPVPVAKEMPLPTFEMARLIYFGSFVQRLEPLFLPMWGLAALLKLSIGLYAILSIIARMLKLPYYRPLILPVSIIILSLAFWPPNVSTALEIKEIFIRSWGWVPTFGIPVILLAVAVLRGRRAAV